MNDASQIAREILSRFDSDQRSLAFERLGLDSIDFLELRINLENKTEHRIPDSEWVSFTSLQDIQDYFDRSSNGGAGARATLPESAIGKRSIKINMPQMVLGGLSENWLFKELGDLHWTLVCDALGSPSHELVDSLNNRLYATFVRIRLESTHRLMIFQENERLTFQGEMARFGKSMFFSDVLINGEGKEIQVSLMTTFSIRQSDNKSLLKGEPTIPESCRVEEKLSMPAFGMEYREMRKGEVRKHTLAQETFTVRAPDARPLFETTYEINPYQDLNGVNLLYFAAYPMINDICEHEFIEQHHPQAFKKHWASEASTIARDIFYYGNCDINDGIVFQVNSCEFTENRRMKLATSLLRQSDSKLIANIFTVKEISTDNL